MTEQWRPVPGWSAYEVSNFGRVRRAELIMKPWRTRAGRWQIRLSQNGRVKTFCTYRLVALAFLGPVPFPDAVVAHIDDNKDNNTLANLKWCTQRENYDDAIRNGRTARGLRNGAHTKPHCRVRGERVGGAKLTEAAVREIRSTAEVPSSLAERFGVTKTLINMVRRGTIWKHVA